MTPLAAGCRDFNRGEYFKAHEHWEALWRRRKDSGLRAHLQGMIQSAGVFVLLMKGREDAARRLADRALVHLNRGKASIRITIPGLAPVLRAVLASRPDNPGASRLLARARKLRARLLVA